MVNTAIERSKADTMPIVVWVAAVWQIIVAGYLGWLAWDIFNMPTLTILGKAADLGKPVQIFATLVVFVPALVSLVSAGLLLRRDNRGRYMALVVDFVGLALGLFGLGGVWGFYYSFERLVDGIMGNPILLLGFPIAYGLYWLGGRISAKMAIHAWLELSGLGLAMLTLMGILLNAGFLDGMNYALSQYATLQAWLVTIAVVMCGLMVWFLLHLGEYYGETPDQRVAWQGWLMLSPNIIGFMFFFAGPLLLSLYLSFTNSSVGRVPEVTWFENYGRVLALEVKTTADATISGQSTLTFGYTVLSDFSFGGTRIIVGARDRLFWVSMYNTFRFCMMLLPLAIIPALGMSLVLNSSLPGVKFFRALYFLPSVAAVVGTALIWRWLYDPTIGFISYGMEALSTTFGFADPDIQWLTDPNVVLISVVLLSAWQVVGYNTVLFLAGLQNIPTTLYEAAQIDGANPWQQFLNVTVPMLAPTTFFVIITTMVTGLQVFNEPYALFPSRPIPENATTSVYYMYTQGFNQFQFGYSSAIAWVLFIIIFGLTLIQFRVNRSEAYQ